jgi:HPt (histidine-containing phosphotransfer) domain-containing protein
MNKFDQNHALTYLDNDPQFLVQVVKAMQDILREQQAVMKQALNQGNWARMRQCTHSHLPTLKILGLSAAAEVFEMFESAVSRQDMDALSNLKTSVMSHWHDSEKVLADWLISQTDLELVPPLRQHETMNYFPTSPRLLPVDGP